MVWDFAVEGDAADAIDAGDASAPNKAEHESRAADEGEGLSDYNATSAASSMNVSSPVKRDWAPRPVSTCQSSAFSGQSRAPLPPSLRAATQRPESRRCMAEAQIFEAVRTAGGRRSGKLAGWHPADMAAETLNAIVGRSGIDLPRSRTSF